MNARSNATRWWLARDPREKTMLTVMLVAVAAFVWWYGLLVPLRQVREQARLRYDHSAAEWMAVSAAATVFREQAAAGPRDDAALAAAVLDAAQDAGVAVSRQRMVAPGTFAAGVDAVDAPQLLDWLERSRREHQLAVSQARIGKRDGRLQADITFTPVATGTRR